MSGISGNEFDCNKCERGHYGRAEDERHPLARVDVHVRVAVGTVPPSVIVGVTACARTISARVSSPV